MKKKLSQIFYLLLTALLPISAIEAQQIVFDYNKGTFIDGDYVNNGKLRWLPYGGFITLKIINVNTFRWKVEIDGRNINYLTPVPSELQTLFRLPDQAANKKKIEEGVENTKEPVEQMKAVFNDVRTQNETEGNVSAEKQDLEKKMKTLVEVCEEYLALVEQIANIKFTRIQLINISKQRWEKFSDMQESLPPELSETSMKETYNSFVTYYAKAEAAYSSATKAAKTVQKQTDADLNTAANADKAASTDATKKAVIDAKAADDKAKTDVALIEEASENIEKGYDQISEVDFLKLMEDIMVLQDAMDNEKYFEVVSPPIQTDGDFVAFQIKTTPVKTNSLMPFEFGKTFPMEIPVRGGLKVDFSVGPTFSFDVHARDELYYAGPPTGGNVKLLQNKNKNDISPGLAAMMHAGPRSGKDWRIAGMFGVGAGQVSEKINFSLFGGLSGVFGKRERIMVSSGVSYLRVARLKTDQFALGTEYPASTFKIEDVTEKVFKPSFFISVSYNLSNRIEIK